MLSRLPILTVFLALGCGETELLQEEPDAGAPVPDAATELAALCGPPESPCAVLRDDLVSEAMAWRNGYPSLALDPAGGRPHLLYSVAENGSHGFHATIGGDGAWETEALPADTQFGALAFDASGKLFAQVAATETALLAREPDGWRRVSATSSFRGGYPAGLAFDEADALHAIVGQGSRFAHGVAGPGPEWMIEPLGDPTLTEYYGLPGLTLSAAGMQTYYWEGHVTPEPDWLLMWSAPPQPAEEVLRLGFPIIGWSPVGFAVTASGRPHLLAERSLGETRSAIVWAARQGPGDWTQVVVAEGDVHPWYGFSCGEPGPEGRECSYDVTTFRPLAMISRGEDVRLFFVKYHPHGRLVAHCEFECRWMPKEQVVEGELRVAWPAGDGVDQAVVLDGLTPEGGMAVVDAAGQVHLAVYDGGLESWDLDVSDLSRVRYLVLGTATLE